MRLAEERPDPEENGERHSDRCKCARHQGKIEQRHTDEQRDDCEQQRLGEHAPDNRTEDDRRPRPRPTVVVAGISADGRIRLGVSSADGLILASHVHRLRNGARIAGHALCFDPKRSPA